MNLNCLLGKHAWDGCRCTGCQRIRDEQHDWKKDCSRCARCGAARVDAHDWQGCKCRRCGLTRNESHDFRKDCARCSRCGASRPGAHDWGGCKCRVCGRTRDEEHDWGQYCSRCAVCGAVRPDAHDWNGCTCRKCGLTRDEQHDWDSSRRCRICAARQADPRNAILLQRHEVGALLVYASPQDRDRTFEKLFQFYRSRNARKHLEKRTARDEQGWMLVGLERRNFGGRHFVVLRDPTPASVAQMEEHKLLCAQECAPAAAQLMYYQEILEVSEPD